MICLRRPFASSLSNYYKVRGAAAGYGFTLFLTSDTEAGGVFGTGLNTRQHNHGRAGGL